MNDLVNRLWYRVNNPSAWPEGFDQSGSNLFEEAADHIEAQSNLIEELASELANGVELLEIIKEHWIDYDHIYSIFAHEAKELASKALSKSNPNTPERNDK